MLGTTWAHVPRVGTGNPFLSRGFRDSAYGIRTLNRGGPRKTPLVPRGAHNDPKRPANAGLFYAHERTNGDSYAQR